MIRETQTEWWTNQLIFKSKQGGGAEKNLRIKCLTIKLQCELRTQINQIWKEVNSMNDTNFWCS